MTDLEKKEDIPSPSTGIEPGRHHISKTYIPLMMFRGFWTALLVAIVAVLNFEERADVIMRFMNFGSMVLFVAIGFIILMGIFGFIIWLSYKRLTWEITEDELHIYKGLVVKKKSHIPFRRIHSVNIEAKILDRIFGVVTVKFDTAAGSGGSEDAKLPAMKLSTAEMLRKEIFQRKNSEATEQVQGTIKGGGNILDGLNKENDNIRGVFAGDPISDLDPESEYRLTNKELVLLCISNGKAFAIIFAIALFIFQFINTIGDIGDAVVGEAEKTVDTLLSMGPVIITGLLMAVLVISIIISFISRALTYGNFVAKRYGTRIEISRGLVQKHSTGVAVERIQILKVKQGLIQRILGYAELSLQTASDLIKTDNDNQEINTGVVIHPFIKVSSIDEYMIKMLKEFSDRPTELEGLSGLAMRRSVVRYCMWTALFVILPLNIGWWILKQYVHVGASISFVGMDTLNNTVIGLSIAILVLMTAIGWGAWRGRAYAQNDGYIAMRSGVLGRERSYVPKKKIQFAMVNQNPFQKRVKLATIKANTAVMGSSFDSIKDVDIDLANNYLGWIEKGNETVL